MTQIYTYSSVFNTVLLIVIQPGLIHMEIMTFDPDNPSKTAM